MTKVSQTDPPAWKKAYALWRRYRGDLATLLAVVALIVAVAALLRTCHSEESLPPSGPSYVVEELSRSVIALGVQRTGEHQTAVDWVGTGFAVRGTEWCITAGHVLLDMIDRSNDLLRRDLWPRFVAATADGQIHELSEMQIHPSRAEFEGSLTGPPYTIDIGRFRLRTRSAGLPLPTPLSSPRIGERIGDEVASAGFPTAIATITYPIDPTGPLPLGPTVKFGRVERLCNLEARVAGGFDRHDLIQHNIPLVGGFSGAPIVNMNGEVVAVATVSTHVHLDGIRFLNPAGVNFGVHWKHVSEWIRRP